MTETDKGLSFASKYLRDDYYVRERPSYARATRSGYALISSLVSDPHAALIAAKIEDIYRTGANKLAAEGYEYDARVVISQGRSKEERFLRLVGMGAHRVIEHWGTGPHNLPELQAMADAIDKGELSPLPKDSEARYQFAGALATSQR